MRCFARDKEVLKEQFTNASWIEDSGLSPKKLEEEIKKIEGTGTSRARIKADTFGFLAENAPIAVTPKDVFQEKLFSGDLMKKQQNAAVRSVKEFYFPEKNVRMRDAWQQAGAYRADVDFGHTSPNSRVLVSLGLSGLLARVNAAAARGELSEKQREFYDTCTTVLRGMIRVAERLADAIRIYNAENAAALRAIATRAPETTYEAMQLLILYFYLHEYVAGTRVRTLGRLDVLLTPFYEADLAAGRYTREELRELLRYFLYKFFAMNVPFGLPFCIGGEDEHGNDVTNEVTYLIVDVFDELNIHSPKIHVRACDKTPRALVLKVLDCIRRGNSSFVFVNDRVAKEALLRVGISEKDVWDYLPIGCYEPAVWGKEIGCTGNGGISLGKVAEFLFTGGKDHASGVTYGTHTGIPLTYEEFLEAVKRQIAFMAEESMSYIAALETHYGECGPDPILSVQYDESVARGVDVYEGGATYNNSSFYYYSIATLVDAIVAVKRMVYEEKALSFVELGEILKSNWEGREDLRLRALRLPHKYGCADPVADEITLWLADYCASLTNGRPNGRGGVFKAACFTIDRCYFMGEKTMATPDGRRTGDPLSKNFCATVGMDKSGVTALINSVTKMDHAAFPNGTVLDVVIHPSAVAGEDGLAAFYGLVSTYFKKGGLALHGNVFDAAVLRDAREHPEKYENLQVRVCGWNAYFTKLTQAEQNAFIRQAETSRL